MYVSDNKIERKRDSPEDVKKWNISSSNYGILYMAVKNVRDFCQNFLKINV